MRLVELLNSDWGRTVTGALISAAFAVLGWRRSARAARKLQDEANLRVLMAALQRALDVIPYMARKFSVAIANGHRFGKHAVAGFDLNLARVDECWQSIQLLEERELAGELQDWLEDVRIARSLLNRFLMAEPGGSAPVHTLEQRTRSAAHWLEVSNRGDDLYNKLGFKSARRWRDFDPLK